MISPFFHVPPSYSYMENWISPSFSADVLYLPAGISIHWFVGCLEKSTLCSCLLPSGRYSATFTGVSHPQAGCFSITTNATSYKVPGDSFVVSNFPCTSSQHTFLSSATSMKSSLHQWYSE